MKETTMAIQKGMSFRIRATRAANAAIAFPAIMVAVVGLSAPSIAGATQPTSPTTSNPAATATAGGDQGRRLMISVLEGQCDAVFTKSKTVDKAGKTSETYEAPSSTLHKCLYVVDMRKSGCVVKGNCQTYVAWSAAHPGLNPDLPRQAFLEAVEGHRGALPGERKPTGAASSPR